MTKTIYFIRHAESEDNLKNVWAGWKDSSLSNHGVQQAEALAASLARRDIQFTALYTSDLKRALFTARILHSTLSNYDAKLSTSSPKIPLHITSALREQNFGTGEGKKIVKKDKDLTMRAHYAQGLFPVLFSRSERFPGGESLEDVRLRAENFVDEVLMTLGEEKCQKKTVVGVVSHGIFLGELVAALARKSGIAVDLKQFRGMKNTAWTRVEVCSEHMTEANRHSDQIQSSESNPHLALNAKNIDLLVKVVAINQHSHLSNLHRQKGGIGSMAHDPKQQDIRKFFHVHSLMKNASSKDTELSSGVNPF